MDPSQTKTNPSDKQSVPLPLASPNPPKMNQRGRSRQPKQTLLQSASLPTLPSVTKLQPQTPSKESVDKNPILSLIFEGIDPELQQCLSPVAAASSPPPLRRLKKSSSEDPSLLLQLLREKNDLPLSDYPKLPKRGA